MWTRKPPELWLFPSAHQVNRNLRIVGGKSRGDGGHVGSIIAGEEQPKNITQTGPAWKCPQEIVQAVETIFSVANSKGKPQEIRGYWRMRARSGRVHLSGRGTIKTSPRLTTAAITLPFTDADIVRGWYVAESKWNCRFLYNYFMIWRASRMINTDAEL